MRALDELGLDPGPMPLELDPMAGTGARLLSDIPATPAPPTLLGRLDPLGSTVLFGTGGVGKGVMASWWTCGLVEAGHRVLLVDYEAHPGEWARRIGTLGGSAITEAVMYVSPNSPEWTRTRGPLWAQADDLRELATEHGATYAIVDSAVPACAGMDPSKAETIGLYAGGLARIGRPSLTLAHVTKASDGVYPFGSVFWHNLSRITWQLSREGDDLRLINRKANNYPHLGRFAVSFTWHDGILGEVSERPYSVVMGDRIAELLAASGPLTLGEIVGELSADGDAIKANTVTAALHRGAFVLNGQKWGPAE